MFEGRNPRIEIRSIEPLPTHEIPAGKDAILRAEICGGRLEEGEYVLILESPATVRSLEIVDTVIEEGRFDGANTLRFRLGQEMESLTIQATLEFDSALSGNVPVSMHLHRAAATSEDPGKIASSRQEFRRLHPQTMGVRNMSEDTEISVTSKEVAANQWTDDVVLMALIKKSTKELQFDTYRHYMDLLLCGKAGVDLSDAGCAFQGFGKNLSRRFLPFNDTDAYRYLKVATEAFVAVKSGVNPVTFKHCSCDNGLPLLDGEFADLARRINATISFPRSADGQDAAAQQYKERYLKDLPPKDVVKDTKDDVLPYFALIHQKLKDLPLKSEIFPVMGGEPGEQLTEKCTGLVRLKLTCPIMIELIWSYWHEQGMLCQTMYAIRDRFQNRRNGPHPDPLAAMEIGYLRPLNNILWGYIQDEQHRLTLLRRCYEYDHHYGLTLQGKAVPPLTPADSRAKFLEAFHNLLYLCTVFFKEDDDTNRKADAFPVLNAIKEVHFLLSEGAQNQFGDLPTTARIEMLMEQWLLARPEMREFLPSRESIAYPEDWMGPVDSMKSIQGWTNTSVMYFHDLAVFGEQILLSVRYNNWSQVFDRNNAANWARVWRSEIQGYMHAYRTVAGVDLTIEPTEPRLQERRLDPSVLLGRRLEEQRRVGAVQRGGPRLPASPSAGIRLPQQIADRR